MVGLDGEAPTSTEVTFQTALDSTLRLTRGLGAIRGEPPGTITNSQVTRAVAAVAERLTAGYEIAKQSGSGQADIELVRMLEGVAFDVLARISALAPGESGGAFDVLLTEVRCTSFLVRALPWAAPGPLAAPAPQPAATRDGRWFQDIRYLQENLPELSPRLFVRTSREQFNASLADLSGRVSEMTDEEIAIAIQMVLAGSQDAHIGLDIAGAAGFAFKRLPVEFIVLRDGLFVISATDEYVDLIGKEVLSFGTRFFKADFGVQAMGKVGSSENYYGTRATAGLLLSYVDVLRTSTVIPQGRALQIFVQHGSERLVVFEPTETSVEPPLQYGFADAMVPRWLQTSEPYWLERLNEDSLYVRYASMTESPGTSPTEFVAQINRELEASPAKRVVIDLRHNGGGVLSVPQPLLDALEQRRANGDSFSVVGLIDGATVSAALFFAHNLRVSLDAVLIGEPAAQKLAASAAVRWLRLPNSGLGVSYPVVRISLGPDARDFEQDVSVPVDSTAFFAGRDPVLEEALER